MIAEQGEELRPGPEAEVHGVRVTLFIGSQALEQPMHSVMPHVKSAAR